MSTFIIRRLLQTLVVTLILSYFVFYLMTLMPGDPVDIMISANPKITTEDIARLKKLYGLDQPSYVRYWHWISDVAQGDLGYSRTYKVPVTQIIGPRLINTFFLSIAALALSLIVAIPLGIISALKSGSKIDYLINLGAFAGISIPSFALAIMLIIFFAVWIPLFPAGGTNTVDTQMNDWETLIDRLKYLILPTISLATLQIGRYVRFTRSSMQEAMRNDYIRTAFSKGLDYWVVVTQHGFRNALLPLITVVALSVSSIFSGAILTETVFAYQGVGKLVFDSVIASDFNMAMVSFMISIVMVLFMNLIADILYGFADPRITYK